MEETLWAGTPRLVFSLTLFILLKVITAHTSCFRGDSCICVCVYIWVHGYGLCVSLSGCACIYLLSFYVQSNMSKSFLKVHILSCVLTVRTGSLIQSAFFAMQWGSQVDRAESHIYHIPLGEVVINDEFLLKSKRQFLCNSCNRQLIPLKKGTRHQHQTVWCNLTVQTWQPERTHFLR